MIEFMQKVGGVVKINVEQADGTMKYGPGLDVEFNNIVTDAGLNALASTAVYRSSNQGLCNWCAVGSGNSTPAAGQTALDSQVGTRIVWDTGYLDSKTGYVAGPPPYTWVKFRYIAATGQIVGNISEIGFFSAATGGIMLSRALIKDEFGNPTTITLLSTERLTVYYEFRRYSPATDMTGVININGTDYTWVSRAANVGQATGPWRAFGDATNVDTGNKTNSVLSTQTLGATTGAPSGTRYRIGDTSYAAYTNGTFYRDFTVSASAGQGVIVGGIGSVGLLSEVSDGAPGYALYQVSFTPKIPKTNLQTLTISGRVRWGRV